MAKDPIFYSLLEACSKPGCPVCQVTIQLVDRYLHSLFYESINDVPTRQDLRSSRGFCSKHAWQLLDGEAGNALGIAIIYQDVFTNLLRALPEPDAAPNTQGKVSSFFNRTARKPVEALRRIIQALRPEAPCPACREQVKTAELVVSILLIYLQDESLSKALEKSDGLCLPHLAGALEHANEPGQVELLLAQNQPQITSLKDELGEFIRKNDHRFAKEGFGDESNSWKRAIRKASGERET
jgi:hypothetical protein